MKSQLESLGRFTLFWITCIKDQVAPFSGSRIMSHFYALCWVLSMAQLQPVVTGPSCLISSCSPSPTNCRCYCRNLPDRDQKYVYDISDCTVQDVERFLSEFPDPEYIQHYRIDSITFESPQALLPASLQHLTNLSYLHISMTYLQSLHKLNITVNMVAELSVTSAK